MTSNFAQASEAFVWIWLPESTAPVVAGRITQDADRFVFNYGASYLERTDAIPIYAPELPLRRGIIEPQAGLSMASFARFNQIGVTAGTRQRRPDRVSQGEGILGGGDGFECVPGGGGQAEAGAQARSEEGRAQAGCAQARCTGCACAANHATRIAPGCIAFAADAEQEFGPAQNRFGRSRRLPAPGPRRPAGTNPARAAAPPGAGQAQPRDRRQDQLARPVGQGLPLADGPSRRARLPFLR